jgi:FkbM family methyltransferase
MSIIADIASWRKPKAKPVQPLAPLTVGPDDFIKQTLAEWKSHAQNIRNIAQTGQEFIEPYVLQKRIAGYDLNLLIATRSSQQWYDHLSCMADIEYVSQLRMIPPGAAVLDLGAHQGVYAVLFSKMAGQNGRVYAFEPFPVNAAIAQFNAVLNNCQIDVFEVGLSNKNGTATVNASTESVVQDESETSLTITLDKLDNYAYLAPDFIKIDVEGAEIDALSCSEKLLANRPNIYLEVHTSFFKRYGRTIDELFEVLPLQDYRCIIMHPGKPIGLYERQFEITEHCCMYLTTEEADRRIR